MSNVTFGFLAQTKKTRTKKKQQANGSWADDEHCFFDSRAGSLWDQRLKQVLLSRGIAVLQVNPGSPDSWDAWPDAWDTGNDQPVLRKLFAELRGGAFGE